MSSTVTTRKNRPAKESSVVKAAIAHEEAAAETAVSRKGRKAAKAAAEAAAKAEADKAIAEMVQRIADNDARLLRLQGQVVVGQKSIREAIDELVSSVAEPHSVAALREVMRQTDVAGRCSRFDYFRLRAAFAYALVLRAEAEAKAANTIPAKLHDEVSAAAGKAAAEAAKELQLCKPGSDADELRYRGMPFFKASVAILRFGWLREIAERSSVDLQVMTVDSLSPFVRRVDGSWVVRHPKRTTSNAKNGDKSALTTEEESKLRDIVTRFAARQLTQADMRKELAAAGFTKAKGKGKGGKGKPGATETPVKAAGNHAPETTDYKALGAAASQEQAAQFILAWAAGIAKQNKIASAKLLKQAAETL